MKVRVGDRAYLKFHPEAWGTVSKTDAAGRFRVTWYTPDHGRKNPRLRVWYDRESLVSSIGIGVPA